MSPIPVILLKESSRSCSANTPDPYAYLLSRPSSGSSKPSYAPYYVPVFETGFSNETELDSLLSQGGDRWRGVIISSQRAVEAWKSSALRVGKAWESDEALQNQGKGKGKGKERVGESDGEPGFVYSYLPITTDALIAHWYRSRLGLVFDSFFYGRAFHCPSSPRPCQHDL